MVVWLVTRWRSSSPSLSLSTHAAKQKLEDRLAAAAREKLAQASKESKEKQLQAERKRKAALFLQRLRPLGEAEAHTQLEVSGREGSTPPKVKDQRQVGMFVTVKVIDQAEVGGVMIPRLTDSSPPQRGSASSPSLAHSHTVIISSLFVDSITK